MRKKKRSPSQLMPIIISEGLHNGFDRLLSHWVVRRSMLFVLLCLIAVTLNHNWAAGPQPRNHFWWSVAIVGGAFYLLLMLPTPKEEQ